MEADLRHHLISTARAFCAAKALELSTVSRLAAGDGRFFDRLDATTFTARKYDAVMAWFSENWPASAAWPADVPRPQREAA